MTAHGAEQVQVMQGELVTMDAAGGERYDGELLPTMGEHWAAAYLALNVLAWREREERKARQPKQRTTGVQMTLGVG